MKFIGLTGKTIMENLKVKRCVHGTCRCTSINGKITIGFFGYIQACMWKLKCILKSQLQVFVRGGGGGRVMGQWWLHILACE